MYGAGTNVIENITIKYHTNTGQKMLSIEDFFSKCAKCDQIRRKLRIWLY